jgi:hypothetical protein
MLNVFPLKFVALFFCLPLIIIRDPFYLSANSTIIESKRSGVETPPCASGWCSKIIEGRENRKVGNERIVTE